MADRLQIWNDALAELPSAPVTAPDEKTLEARECARAYPLALASLLEIHDWGMATKRAALAATANDRAAEWLHAYAVPADMGTPRGIVIDTIGYPVGSGAGQGIAPLAAVFSIGRLLDEAYLIDGGRIYTNRAAALFEYGVNDVSESVMSEAFARALSLALAARIAMPIKKDRQLKADLLQQAEVAKVVAMADDQNRHPRIAASYQSEAALVRGA